MVLVVDYKMNNLGSLRRSLELCGGNVVISDHPQDLEGANKIILPGIGAFPDAMRNLTHQGWIPALKKEVLENKKPLLGICLGMQLLADVGFEVEKCTGLGLIPGHVKKLVSTHSHERIPHVGWNEISIIKKNKLFETIPQGSDFYFVHSYHIFPDDKDVIVCTTPYCTSFVSAVNKDNIFGVQFHPEKSSSLGFTLLKNFLEM
ncbi:MAG: imidazole glycerol phosphate synthase subunit HisH [bacterium]